MATGGEVFAQEVDCVVDDDPERHRGDDRCGQTHIAHDVTPQAERHRRGEEVGYQAHQTEKHAPEHEDQNQRNQYHGDDRAAQHALNVALGQVGEDDRDT